MLVVQMGGGTQMIQSVLIRFLVFGVPWSVQGNDMIFFSG
jgi:hypothetical protein